MPQHPLPSHHTVPPLNISLTSFSFFIKQNKTQKLILKFILLVKRGKKATEPFLAFSVKEALVPLSRKRQCSYREKLQEYRLQFPGSKGPTLKYMLTSGVVF